MSGSDNNSGRRRSGRLFVVTTAVKLATFRAVAPTQVLAVAEEV